MSEGGTTQSLFRGVPTAGKKMARPGGGGGGGWEGGSPGVPKVVWGDAYPEVLSSVLDGLHAVLLVPGVGLAGAAQQFLVLQAEERNRGAMRAAGARGPAAGPARALRLLPQQGLHQVVERVVGAQLPGIRSFLAHRAQGRRLHLPAAGHAPAAEVVAAAQSHRVAERVVAYSAQQLLFKGERRPRGHRRARLHRRGSPGRSHHRRLHA